VIKPYKKQVSWFLVFIWLVVIFIFSGSFGSSSGSLSGSVVSSIQPYLPRLSDQIVNIIVRKSAHLFMYGMLGVLLANLLHQYQLTKKAVYGYGLVIAFTYAGFDEIHQYFVGGRSSSLRDSFIDLIGAAIGISIYYSFGKIWRMHKKKVHRGKKTY
jgi:VanZ family protein